MACTGCNKERTIVQQVAHKVGSMLIAYSNKITGNITPEMKRKIAICKACSSNKPILQIDWCMECGCPTDIKALSDKEFCKLNKW